MRQSIKRFLNRARERGRSFREGREHTTYEIVHDDASLSISWLTLENETGETIIEWRDIVAIFAFKRSLVFIDSIRLCFSLSDDRTVEIHEGMKGWDPLVRQLPEYLKGCQPFDDWFDTVALPPFETNWTQIYQRLA